jgi:hypothetical protein
MQASSHSIHGGTSFACFAAEEKPLKGELIDEQLRRLLLLKKDEEKGSQRPSWTVHDGFFFVRNLRTAQAQAPQERRLLGAATALRSSSQGKLGQAEQSAARAVRSSWLLDGVTSSGGSVNKLSLMLMRRSQRQPKMTQLPKSLCDVVTKDKLLHPILAWLDLGGDINATDGAGRSLLHFAAVASNEAVAELLIKRGARLELRTSNEMLTPIFLASMSGHDAIVCLLLAASANPDVPDRERITPLMISCRSGHVSVVRKLVEAGASLKQTDSSGNDAWSYASRHKAITIALRQHMKRAGKDQGERKGTATGQRQQQQARPKEIDDQARPRHNLFGDGVPGASDTLSLRAPPPARTTPSPTATRVVSHEPKVARPERDDSSLVVSIVQATS